MTIAFILAIVVALPTDAIAGGSWEEVRIQSLTIDGTNYE